MNPFAPPPKLRRPAPRAADTIKADSDRLDATAARKKAARGKVRKAGPHPQPRISRADIGAGPSSAAPSVISRGLVGGMLSGLQVVLPYPPSALSGNARHGHWAPKSKQAALYRKECWALTRQAMGRDADSIIARIRGDADASGDGQEKTSGPRTIRIHLDFFPPDGRLRDDDNAESAFKAGRDGVADALAIDDHTFAITRRVHTEKLSCVVATVAFAEPRPIPITETEEE